MLTEGQIVSHLLQRNLLTPQAALEDDLLIIDVSRRNLNYKVTTNHGPCYLVKQATDQNAIATLAHEARIYQALHFEIEGKTFSPHVPRCFDYDSRQSVLVLELVPNAESLLSYHARCGRFPLYAAKAMGRTLGLLHSLENLSTAAAKGVNTGAAVWLPWSLALHRPNPGSLRELSNASIQLIEIIQCSSELQCLAVELKHSWRGEVLIHNDIKWDNWIVCASGKEASRLKLIDWELARLGDPCWDIGSVFSQYLSSWLSSLPITREGVAEDLVDLAGYPLHRMHPAARAFWQSYVETRGMASLEAEKLLLRAINHAAARLVHIALEQAQQSSQLLSTGVCLLQLSANIAERPHEALIHLLGIPLQVQTYE
jgi:aminoglycoside phosphotransferase (APT) family kinase protein